MPKSVFPGKEGGNRSALAVYTKSRKVESMCSKRMTEHNKIH